MNSFKHEPRKTFDAKERAKLFAAADGKCANCNRKIPSGMDWDLDHRIPLADGGTNADDNLQVLCYLCHSAKTKDDVAEIAKGKRSYIKANVPKRFRQSNGWGRR
jgi:5-methylcytosine-specific restriction protein A